MLKCSWGRNDSFYIKCFVVLTEAQMEISIFYSFRENTMHKQGKQYNPEVLLIKIQCRSVYFTNICLGTWTLKFCQYLHHLWNYCSPISTVTPNCQRESLPVVNPHGATTGLQFIIKQKCYWRRNWCLFPSPHLKGAHFPEIKMLQRFV